MIHAALGELALLLLAWLLSEDRWRDDRGRRVSPLLPVQPARRLMAHP
jgi:hypothetical protein